MSPLPSAIGPYRIIRHLGSGGMGAVYLALDTKLDRHVALKILHTTLDSPENRQRLLREARLAAKLKHRNIVTIYSVDDDEGLPYIVMEYVVGETLANMIQARMPMGMVRRLDLIDEVCAGLVYAWKRAGLVHRDVKPSNLMVDREEVVRILDFGIARAVHPGATSGTVVAGTPAYMAPEQIENRPLDHRCDVFSVGVVMYELLTYRRAFHGDSYAAVFQQVLRCEPVPLLECDPGIDPELALIVARAMCRAPEDRYQDLQQMRDDLAPVRERLARTENADTTGFPQLTTTVPMPPPTSGSGPPGIWSGPVRPAPQAAGPPEAVLRGVTPSRAVADAVLVSEALQPGPGSVDRARLVPGWLEQARRHLEAGEPDLASELVEQARLRGGPTDEGEALRREIDEAVRKRRHAPGSAADEANGVEVHIRPGASPTSLLDVAIPHIPASVAPVPAAGRRFPAFALMLAGLLLAAAVVAWWLTGRLLAPVRSPATLRVAKTAAAAIAAPALILRVDTEPAGATVRIEGIDSEWTAPADVPIAAPYTPRVHIAAKGRLPASRLLTEADVRAGTLRVALAPAPVAPITAVLSGPFAFEVLAGGKVVSESRTSHRLVLPATRALQLRAASLFLARTVTVRTEPGGTFEYREPEPGRLTVRTTPVLERCRVSVDGRDFDDPPYPPILDRAIASGQHVIVLTCPDGEPRRETVTVGPGRADIVTIR